MWLLLLELIAPVAIVLMIHEKYPELFLYVAEEHDHLLSDDSDVSFGGQVLE